MKKITVLLALASSLLSACATREAKPLPVQSEQPKPAPENYCPPTQAIKGIC